MVWVNYPYVVEDCDRHGNVRIYFRRKGQIKVRIRETPGTEAFERRYRELVAKSHGGQFVASERHVGRQPDRGTWRWLCVAYLGSAEFRALDPATQRPRRGILESTYDEPVRPGAAETFADYPLARMTPKAIRVLRDRKEATKPAANNRVKAINAVFSWGVGAELVATNPARDVPLFQVKGGGIYSWSVEDVRKYEKRHPVGTMARLALAIVMFTGVRRSDAVRLGRQHVRDGWFKFRQFKGRNRNPVDIEIPILPELQQIIDATETGELTYLVTSFGRPFTDAGFGNKMRQWCDEAGLPHCSAHGIRKAGAAVAAENGATAHQLMSIFGWLTLKEAERYTRAAQRRKMAGAAMHLVLRDGT